MKSRKTLLFMMGTIIAVLIITVAVILIRKNDDAKNSTEGQYITEDEDLDKDNVVDGSQLFDDEVEAEGLEMNQGNSGSQDNTNNSGNKGTSTNQNNAGTGSTQNDSDNTEEDNFGDGTLGEEEDANNDNKVEDKETVEWTPNY